MDYNKYCFSCKELGVHIFTYGILNMAVSMLFYRSLIVFAALLPGFYFFLKEKKKEVVKNQKKVLHRQFLSGIQAVSTALGAGYSPENAFIEAIPELKKVYKEKDFIIREFEHLIEQIKINRNLEDMLIEWGIRSGIEDIYNFGEVFASAKRTGGSLTDIIKNTVLCVSQKEEALLEIETCLAAKKMELKIMCGVPFGILVYVGSTSPDFLEKLYHNPAGIVIMTVCLMVYLGSYYCGKKIMDIEV